MEADSQSEGSTTLSTLAAPVHTPMPRWYQFPIRTQLPRIPWLWASLMQTSWLVALYIELCSTQTMTFTLKKFIAHPMLIALVTSLNTVYNMLVGATSNYLSDRVWTRFGRRKPFMLAACAATVLCLAAIPFVRSFWVLFVLLFLYEAARDMSAPTEALVNEVVPPHQRGRAGVIRKFMEQIAVFVFFSLLLARFDNQYHLTDSITITGEMLIYWTGVLLAAGYGVFLLLAVREVRPMTVARKIRPVPGAAHGLGPVARIVHGLRTFFRDIFADRQLRMVYLLMFSAQGTWLGLGNLAPLLFTDQWHYDKAAYGSMIGYITPAALVAAPLAGWLVDRFNRLKLFIYGLIILIFQHLGFYIYCRYLAPSGIPSQSFLIIYPLCFALVGQTASLAAVTTVFDYIPSNQLGTFGSGWALIYSVTSLVINNGVAIWITGMSHLFPRPGVTYDYLSGYLYMVLLSIVFLAAALYFAREERKGHLVKYGVLEREENLGERAPGS